LQDIRRTCSDPCARASGIPTKPPTLFLHSSRGPRRVSDKLGNRPICLPRLSLLGVRRSEPRCLLGHHLSPQVSNFVPELRSHRQRVDSHSRVGLGRELECRSPIFRARDRALCSGVSRRPMKLRTLWPTSALVFRPLRLGQLPVRMEA
jgi:hypothetical protein